MNMELTPQQSDFAAYYLNPDSPTYSNALQSALKAGFSEEYANNITGQMPNWLSELLGKKKRLLSKAEKVLELTLDQTEDLKLSQDTAKFIAKTVGKQDYSEKLELGGTITNLNADLTDEQFDRLIRQRAEELDSQESGQGTI